MLDNFMGQPMEKQSVAAISDDLYDIAYDQPFRFPATFTFVLRAISTLEGLGKGLDPNFNFMEVAKPYATNLMENGSSKESGNLSTAFFGELGRQAAQVSNTAIALPRRIDDTLAKLDRGDIRVRVKSQETDRLLRRLSNVGIGGIYALLGATCLLCATLLFINGLQIPSVIAAIAAGLFVLVLLRLLSKIDRPER
jgi:predicted unusual protein kinase regulating ubiquinone biosynthesis (AarF/ABC1/UbiB family)